MAMKRILLLLVISAFATVFPAAKKVHCEGGYCGICEKDGEDEGLPLSWKLIQLTMKPFPKVKKKMTLASQTCSMTPF